MKANMKSAIYYFNKYGCFFDKQISVINRSTLKQILEKD